MTIFTVYSMYVPAVITVAGELLVLEHWSPVVAAFPLATGGRESGVTVK